MRGGDFMGNSKLAFDPVAIFNSRIEDKQAKLNRFLIDMAQDILRGAIGAENCDKVLLEGIRLSRDLSQDLRTWEYLTEKEKEEKDEKEEY